MKPMLALLALLLPCSALPAQPLWQVDSSSVTFQIKNAGLPVRGSFGGLEADVRFDPDAPERSSIQASVDASTVETGINLRNKHLQKRDYFNVHLHPRIRMESAHLAHAEAGGYRATFRLFIKDIEQEVAMPFTYTPHERGATLDGRFTLDRLDFELGKESRILADEVEVLITVVISRHEP